MNKEALLLSPKYDFAYLGGPFNSYFFQTKQGIVYEVTFKPSDYLFGEHTLLGKNTFKFSVLVAENNTGKTPPSDALIPITIAGIFFVFSGKVISLLFISAIPPTDKPQSVIENSISGSIGIKALLS